MGKSVFKRKIYNEILEWKNKRSDKYALLIKGARRIGKTTIAEEFAKNEYYLLLIHLLFQLLVNVTFLVLKTLPY